MILDLVLFGAVPVFMLAMGFFVGHAWSDVKVRSAEEMAGHWYRQFDAEREKRAAIENRVRSLSLKLSQLADCDGNCTDADE